MWRISLSNCFFKSLLCGPEMLLPLESGRMQPRQLQPQHSSEVTCCAAQQHTLQHRLHQLAPRSCLRHGAAYQRHQDTGLGQPGEFANLQLNKKGNKSLSVKFFTSINVFCNKRKQKKLTRRMRYIHRWRFWETWSDSRCGAWSRCGVTPGSGCARF